MLTRGVNLDLTNTNGIVLGTALIWLEEVIILGPKERK